MGAEMNVFNLVRVDEASAFDYLEDTLDQTLSCSRNFFSRHKHNLVCCVPLNSEVSHKRVSMLRAGGMPAVRGAFNWACSRTLAAVRSGQYAVVEDFFAKPADPVSPALAGLRTALDGTEMYYLLGAANQDVSFGTAREVIRRSGSANLKVWMISDIGLSVTFMGSPAQLKAGQLSMIFAGVVEMFISAYDGEGVLLATTRERLTGLRLQGF